MKLVSLYSLVFMLLSANSHAENSPLIAPSINLTQEEIDQKLQVVFSVFPNPATTNKNFTEFDHLTNLIFNETLGIAPDQLDLINRFYAHLKQEAVKNYLEETPAPAGYTQKSLSDALTHEKEQVEVAAHLGDSAGLITAQKKLTALEATITAAIEKNVVPNSIALCRQTATWQNHLKVFIANSFVYELELLGNINQDEIKMFSFLPQFETVYYTEPYQNLRNSSEYVRMFLVLTDILRQRALAQCDDWNTITDLSVLYETIEDFKSGDFYTFSKSFDEITASKKLTPLLNQIVLPPSAADKNYSIAVGYRSYLTGTLSKQGEVTLEPCPGMDGLFSITGTSVSLTPLGAFVLEESVIKPATGSPYKGLIRTANFNKLFIETAVLEESVIKPATGSPYKGLIGTANSNKLFTETYIGYTPTNTFIELLAFNAIRTLNSLTGYLFNSANLSDTMERIDAMYSNNLKTNFSTFPNILFYQPEDLLFLEEINLLSSVLLTSSSSSSQTNSPASWWDSLWDDIEDLIEKMAETLKSGFEKIGGDLWHAVKACGNVFVHLAYAVEDFGIGLYYQTGLACVVTGESWSESQEQAGSYFNQVGAQIGDATTSLENVVNDVFAVAQQVINTVSSVIGEVGAEITQDPALGNDMTACFDSIGAIAVDALRDSVDFLVGVAGNLVKLTVEAVDVISVSCSDIIMGGNFAAAASIGNYFVQDLVSSILNCASLLVTILSDVLKNLMSALAYLTAAIVELIIDISAFIGGLASLMTGGSYMAGEESWRSDVAAHSKLISSIVTAVIMVAITVATLGTGSALAIAFSAIMLTMTLGMMAISCVGANQQDLSAASKLLIQEDFLNAFTQYVTDSEPAQYSIQAAMLNETKMRLFEQEINADRGLVYFQNYLNNTVNSLRTTQAYQLGAFYDQQLTPDATTGLLPADTGYFYGIETNRLDLNPSKGFRVYNNGRSTFAQEIATKPALVGPSAQSNQTVDAIVGQQSTTPTQTQSTHFIAQKDLCNLTAQDGNTLKIRWRIIYESGGDFYIGIYYNQNYLDTNFLHTLNTQFEKIAQNRTDYSQQDFEAAWNPLKTFNRYLYNFDDHAKAFVCYQNNQTNNKPALGIYEHSPLQFLPIANNHPAKQKDGSAWFKLGTWYTMTVQLSGNSMNATFQEEDNQTNYWSAQTQNLTPFTDSMLIPYEKLIEEFNAANPSSRYTSTKSYAGSFGVITSGAAVEYEIITPKQTVTPSKTRVQSNATYAQNNTTPGVPIAERQREQQWTTQFAKNKNPQFANWKLIPYSDLSIAQGSYVYKTLSTGITIPKALSYQEFSDYVVSLSNPPGAGTLSNVGHLVGSSAQLGSALTSSTEYLISLVTGNTYNTSGQLMPIAYPDALTAYQQKNGTLEKTLFTSISTAQQAYTKLESESLAFQNVVVTGISSAIKQGVFIYSCKSFTPYLSGLDYLVFVNIPSDGSQPGSDQCLNPLSPSNSINGALSLVSGIVFTLTSGAASTPISQLPTISQQGVPGWSGITIAVGTGAWSTIFNSAYQQNNKLSQSFITLINNQITAYTKAVQVAQAALEAQEAAAQAAAQAKAMAARAAQANAFYALTHPVPSVTSALTIQNNSVNPATISTGGGIPSMPPSGF